MIIRFFNKKIDIQKYIDNFSKMNIAIILNIQVYLCIFFAILHTEGTHSNKETAAIIKNFLHQPGWYNINDVRLIKYWGKNYELKDLFIEPVTLYNCDNCIRQATLFLGCSYYYDLNLIYLSLIKFQQHCFDLLNSGDDSAHICTVTLLTQMREIVPMAKFMNGALYAIEKYHTIPWNIQKRTPFILSSLLTQILEDETLLFTLRISSDSIRDKLETIAKLLTARRLKIDENNLFCLLKHLGFNSLWNSWNTEFNKLRYQGKCQELFIFLSDKIRNLILTTIMNKYIELGFKFDWNTSQTFLPALPPTNVKQDIAQNSDINLIQIFNEGDTQKVNGTHCKKETAAIIINFLRQPGWNNINDVKLIKYWGKNYELKNLFIKPVTSNNCDNCIRQATLFLGCSYIYDLKLIYLSLIKFQQHCFDLLNSGDDSAPNCTVTLLTQMREIVPMAKCMNGALYAIQIYHNNFLNTRKKTRFILSSLLTKIQEDETLLSTLIISSDSIRDVLETIAKILTARHLKIDEDKSFCLLKHLDFNSLWNSWNTEFNKLRYQGKCQELFIFLSDKIRNLILTTIMKKYIELGFKYDWNTSQTFLPALPPTNVKQDVNCEMIDDDSDLLIKYPDGMEPFNKYIY
ncbi:uncharacterized protein LOC126905459 isoform X2 [Daktulosphaira vitifoliae]|uniref:uncharacterized protein LOC126905459 isoform X2 n=1 Tax=Daktulosphaira vitifoliae TaxID=58002 RepID=UPI0021AA45D3|nr:uncharacterized protein LOC126905459 isoform X2 [Daktulosphaira vitifoliae]